ncbi:hypothetical protein [Micromonospora psammae]|uniref:hypothetical protein n=1 Tax=Micromonospora sp. CPCC 205556 TaxID=3122398 RepID=UPI002FEEF50E
MEVGLICPGSDALGDPAEGITARRARLGDARSRTRLSPGGYSAARPSPELRGSTESAFLVTTHISASPTDGLGTPHVLHLDWNKSGHLVPIEGGRRLRRPS